MRYFNYHSRIIPGLLFVFLLILSVSVDDSRRAGRPAKNVEFTESIRGMQPSSSKSDYSNISIVYDMESIDTKDWIDIHDPECSFGGYTLFFYHQRIPMIMDMNGSIVHVWPEVRGWGRMRLTREGHLILIGTDNLIHEYDWGGNHLWSFDIDRGMDFPHHDFRIGRNGNILCIYRDAGNGTDYIAAVSYTHLTLPTN